MPKYVKYTGGGRRYWRLGGPLTADHEKRGPGGPSAPARPGRSGDLVLRILGGRARVGSAAPP